MKSFSKRLEEEYKAHNYSVRRCAEQARVSETVFRGWCVGNGQPTKVQLQQIFGANTSLVHYLDPVPKPHLGAAADDVEPEPVTKAPPPMPSGALGSLGAMASALKKAGITVKAPIVAPVITQPEPSKPIALPAEPVRVGVQPSTEPWNVILRAWREGEGLTLDDVGDMMELSGNTIGGWERGDYLPIAAHVAKLRTLVSALEGVVIPDARVQAKPGPALGTPGHTQKAATSGGAQAAPLPAAPAPQPAPLPPIVDPMSAIDRVVMAFDQLGQTVGLAKPERIDGVYYMRLVGDADAVLSEGTGASMSTAALDMLSRLRAGFVARQESTRRVVREATARLEAQTRAVDAIDGAVSQV